MTQRKPATGPFRPTETETATTSHKRGHNIAATTAFEVTAEERKVVEAMRAIPGDPKEQAQKALSIAVFVQACADGMRSACGHV